jgi:hypothetical protein
MGHQLVTMMPMFMLQVGLIKDDREIKLSYDAEIFVTVRHTGSVIFPLSQLLTLVHTFSHLGKIIQV